MGSYMGDISNLGSIGSGNQLPADLKVKSKSDSMGLDMTSFLKLMVAELTNQSIDQTADTSDMLNQMVQMQMVQALVNMTDASVMSYAASLVGKQVTVGQYDSEGKLQEVVGTVTGTGTYNGSQVVFVGDKYYPLSEILAVGTLPPKVESRRRPNRARRRRRWTSRRNPKRRRPSWRNRNCKKGRNLWSTGYMAA